MNHFNIGNLKSLRDLPLENGVDIRKELLEFHEKFYSANVMKLVILGKGIISHIQLTRDTLDNLEQLVRPLFSPIKNNNREKDFEGCGKIVAYPKDKLPAWYHIVPVADVHELQIVWPIPSLEQNWREKPDRYLGHLLGHESNGSLFALLKKRGWAIQLVAGTTYRAADIESFTVGISLTSEGLGKDLSCLTVRKR